MAPDFNKVNVFWLARGTENDETVENILKRTAGQLRHELSELRVMGVVPHIEFVKGIYHLEIQVGCSMCGNILFDYGLILVVTVCEHWRDRNWTVPRKWLMKHLKVINAASPGILENLSAW